jgi:hypothetical protein
MARLVIVVVRRDVAELLLEGRETVRRDGMDVRIVDRVVQIN